MEGKRPKVNNIELYQNGILSIEQDLKIGVKECDIGLQTSEDGRIWICVDGMALLRFRPHRF